MNTFYQIDDENAKRMKTMEEREHTREVLAQDID